MTIMIQGRDNWWRGEFWNNFTVFFFQDFHGITLTQHLNSIFKA